ncbi:hypothetical protein ACOSQ3_012968 [Xanthoceras sorbifolium]
MGLFAMHWFVSFVGEFCDEIQNVATILTTLLLFEYLVFQHHGISLCITCNTCIYAINQNSKVAYIFYFCNQNRTFHYKFFEYNIRKQRVNHWVGLYHIDRGDGGCPCRRSPSI